MITTVWQTVFVPNSWKQDNIRSAAYINIFIIVVIMIHIIFLVWKESFDFVSMKQKWEIRDIWETVACCQISSLIIRCDCRISSLVSQQHCGCLLVRTEKSWQGTEPGIAVSSTSPSSPPYLQSFSISLPAFVRPSPGIRAGLVLHWHFTTVRNGFELGGNLADFLYTEPLYYAPQWTKSLYYALLCHFATPLCTSTMHRATRPSLSLSTIRSCCWTATSSLL